MFSATIELEKKHAFQFIFYIFKYLNLDTRLIKKNEQKAKNNVETK